MHIPTSLGQEIFIQQVLQHGGSQGTTHNKNGMQQVTSLGKSSST